MLLMKPKMFLGVSSAVTIQKARKFGMGVFFLGGGGESKFLSRYFLGFCSKP